MSLSETNLLKLLRCFESLSEAALVVLESRWVVGVVRFRIAGSTVGGSDTEGSCSCPAYRMHLNVQSRFAPVAAVDTRKSADLAMC